jgi:arylsulfatase A-like enzyme
MWVNDCLLGSLLLTHLISSVAADVGRPPNVLLIVVDDLGYGDLSSFGGRDIRTPHIDRLMERGIRYDHFYANSPVCSPTRASLMTGRYPDLVGVPGVIRTHRHNSWGRLSSSAVVLPEILAKADYRTACVGKWHLGLDHSSHPNSRGFEFFHGFLGDMMDDYYDHRRHGFNYMRLNETEIDPEGHATDLFSDWAVDYLARAKSSERPFFLYLAYNAPHTPIQPPEEWARRVLARESGIDASRARLVALIEHLDDGIGRVLSALGEHDLEEETLVLLTSDNGGQQNVGANNGRLRGGKQDMWEGGIRVPFCAVWPGRIPPGTRSNGLAITMDLFPTICEAAGVTIEHEIDGRSLLSELTGATVQSGERVLIWVRREGGQRYGGRAYYAIRKGDLKLLQNGPFEPMVLYNLAVDPLERTPLPEGHASYGELFDLLTRHISESGMEPWQRPENATWKVAPR